jgi:hypothetical protein
MDLEILAETGATREEQAHLLGMSVDSLQRRINDQRGVFQALMRAGARMRVSVRRKQIAIALDDRHPAQATMLVWLGKAMLGQTERINLKIETAFDAMAKLKECWPEIPEDQLIKQLSAGGEVIDIEPEPEDEEPDEAQDGEAAEDGEDD